MKGFRMSRRSRYWGLTCKHCNGRIDSGETFLGHTLEVGIGYDVNDHPLTGLSPPGELVRFAYHRACLASIVDNCPESGIASTWEQYRQRLIEQRFREEDDEGVPDHR
jgi:hypothetical protein